MTYNILILALELKTTQRAHDQLRAQEEEITRKWNKASMLSEFQQIKLSRLKIMTVKIIGSAMICIFDHLSLTHSCH